MEPPRATQPHNAESKIPESLLIEDSPPPDTLPDMLPPSDTQDFEAIAAPLQADEGQDSGV
eukprot:5633757-Pyramimonas_sp.AAC.1